MPDTLDACLRLVGSLLPVAVRWRFERRMTDAVFALHSRCSTAQLNESVDRSRNGDQPRPAMVHDPRLASYGILQDILLDAGCHDVRDLRGAALRNAALLAFSADLTDREFVAYLNTLPKDRQEAALGLRKTWVDYSARTKAAEIERAAEESRQRSLRAAWAAERSVPLPPGGLAEWVQTEPPSVWHEIAQNLAFEIPEPTGTLMETLRWIVLHPACDRATALAILVVADQYALYSTAYDGFTPDGATQLMEEAHQRLETGAYTAARFAFSDQMVDSVVGWLEFAQGGEDPLWPLPVDLLETLGDTPHDPPYQYLAHRPVIPYETWLAAQEAVS